MGEKSKNKQHFKTVAIHGEEQGLATLLTSENFFNLKFLLSNKATLTFFR